MLAPGRTFRKKPWIAQCNSNTAAGVGRAIPDFQSSHPRLESSASRSDNANIIYGHNRRREPTGP